MAPKQRISNVKSHHNQVLIDMKNRKTLLTEKFAISNKNATKKIQPSKLGNTSSKKTIGYTESKTSMVHEAPRNIQMDVQNKKFQQLARIEIVQHFAAELRFKSVKVQNKMN